MSKFLFWSDLHTEHRVFTPPAKLPDGLDGILIAGDVANGSRTVHILEDILTKCKTPIRAVLGNHDHYGENHQANIERFQTANETWNRRGMDIRILMGGDTDVLGGTRLIGATLWTDMELNHPMPVEMTMRIVGRSLNDHRLIWWTDETTGRTRNFSPQDARDIHLAEREALLNALNTPFDGPTVVMTHHMPLRDCVHAQYSDMPMNAGFASHLPELVGHPAVDVWIYGHSHNGVETNWPRSDGGVVRVLTNPRGYPREVTPFDPLRTFVV